ncbi:hypothetical protein AB0D24_24195 [Streptomyces javensis]|uniref:hypothetical protein n=1 Tax=Streptomyces javensis TaxID=114698 RepID=UPI0033E3C583
MLLLTLLGCGLFPVLQPPPPTLGHPQRVMQRLGEPMPHEAELTGAGPVVPEQWSSVSKEVDPGA